MNEQVQNIDPQIDPHLIDILWIIVMVYWIKTHKSSEYNSR